VEDDDTVIEEGVGWPGEIGVGFRRSTLAGART
jgi:hypothetical protein